MVDTRLLRQDPATLRNRAATLAYLDEIGKGIDAPKSKSYKSKQNESRCPLCREANNGKGCYLSACSTNAGRSCDCHRIIAGAGAGSHGMSPEELFHYTYRQKQLMPHYVSKIV